MKKIPRDADLPVKEALANACTFYADLLNRKARQMFIDINCYDKKTYDEELRKLRVLAKNFEECESFSLHFTYSTDKGDFYE